jgi:hypothetical protein
MKNTPRDARLAVLAILVACAAPFVPGPSTAHVEHRHKNKTAAAVTANPYRYYMELSQAIAKNERRNSEQPNY